jgi:hypothetical protein
MIPSVVVGQFRSVVVPDAVDSRRHAEAAGAIDARFSGTLWRRLGEPIVFAMAERHRGEARWS